MDHPAEQCTKALGDTCSAAWEVSLGTLHRSARAGRNRNKHAMAPTRQGVLTAAAADAAVKPTAAVDVSAAAAADAAVKPTLLMMMVSAVALAAAITTTASASPSGPAAAPLAVASRLDARGQGMGPAGTSVRRPLILDPRQRFPQFIRLNICYQKHFIFDNEI